MFFFFRRPTVEVISFVPPEFEFALAFTPIKEASKYLPEWWKSLTVSKFDWENLSQHRNVKTCPGVTSIVTKGAILPLWTDLAIRIRDSQLNFQFADKKSNLIIHNNAQAPGFYSDNFILKISSPWVIKTKVPLYYSAPFYHSTDELIYKTPPGVVSPLEGFCASNIFIFLKKHINYNLMINRNTPMLHIQPMTEKKVVYRTEVGSTKDIKKVQSFLSKTECFIASRIKSEKLLKKNES